MKVCRICGEVNEFRYFTRLKGFSEFCRRKIVWCHACMRVFIEMKKLEKQQKELKDKEWVFDVEFK